MIICIGGEEKREESVGPMWGTSSGSNFPMFGVGPRARIVPLARLHVHPEECFFFPDNYVSFESPLSVFQSGSS